MTSHTEQATRQQRPESPMITPPGMRLIQGTQSSTKEMCPRKKDVPQWQYFMLLCEVNCFSTVVSLCVLIHHCHCHSLLPLIMIIIILRLLLTDILLCVIFRLIRAHSPLQMILSTSCCGVMVVFRNASWKVVCSNPISHAGKEKEKT